jgi:hypothetical protein
MKISLISPGKNFVIIENTTSKRKTHSAVKIIDIFINRDYYLEIIF